MRAAAYWPKTLSGCVSRNRAKRCGCNDVCVVCAWMGEESVGMLGAGPLSMTATTVCADVRVGAALSSKTTTTSVDKYADIVCGLVVVAFGLPCSNCWQSRATCPVVSQTRQRKPGSFVEGRRGQSEERWSGLPHEKQADLRLIASAVNQEAMNSGSATDQLMLGLEGIFSLNWASYCSQAYSWNLRLHLLINARYWKSSGAKPGLWEVRTPA